MINDLKFRGCCDNDAQREVQRVKTVVEGMDGCYAMFSRTLVKQSKGKEFL